MQKKEEVGIIHEKIKIKILKILYYDWERVEYTENSLSVAIERDVVERPATLSR